jgi:hypothetical protein
LAQFYVFDLKLANIGSLYSYFKTNTHSTVAATALLASDSDGAPDDTGSKIIEFWECCVCKARIPDDNDVVNLHLNLCLHRQQERKRSKQSSDTETATISSVAENRPQESYSKRTSSVVFDSPSKRPAVAVPSNDGSSSRKESAKIGVPAQDKEDDGLWSCFICNKRLRSDNDVINMHINACLKKEESKQRRDEDHGDSDSDLEDAQANQEYTITFPPESVTYSKYNIRECMFSPVPGLIIIPEFITEAEELSLIQDIDADEKVSWDHTNWTGHMQSKRYGMVTVFGIPRSNEAVNAESILRGSAHKRSSEIRGVREHDEAAGEYGLPDFAGFVVDRLDLVKRDIMQVLYARIQQDARRMNNKQKKNGYTSLGDRSSVSTRSLVQLADSLKIFVPNECNINNYHKSRGDFLRSHCDDRELSGPLLMNLSMCGKAVMRYSLDIATNKPAATTVASGAGNSRYKSTNASYNDKLVVDVPLPRRCLQLISGEGRYKWEHSIPLGALVDERRVSITWRGAGIKGRSKRSLIL